MCHYKGCTANARGSNLCDSARENLPGSFSLSLNDFIGIIMIISVPLPLSPSFLSSFPLAAPRSPASLLITIGDSCHLLFHHFSSRTFCICLRRPSPGCALSVLFRVIYTAVCSAGSRLSACGCFCLCCSPRLISSAAVWRTSVMPPRYMQSERHIYEVTMITPRGSYAFNPVMATCFFSNTGCNSCKQRA